jgi:hypothetical protein
MEDVTRFLRQLLYTVTRGNPPVADNTGLMGTYDIDFALEEILSAPPTVGPGFGAEGVRRRDNSPSRYRRLWKNSLVSIWSVGRFQRSSS